VSKIELKTLQYLVRVVKELRKKPSRPSELEKAIPHKQLYRVLIALKKAGLIAKGDNGKYMWVEDWQKFLDGKGYEIKLNHSKELLKPFIKRENYSSSSIEAYMRDKHIIQHLESGYPEVYVKYKKWLKSEENHRESRERFNEAVMEQARKKGFEIVEYGRLEAGKKQVSHLILGIVEDYLRRKDLEKMRVMWEDGQVWDKYRGVALAKEEKLTEEIEKLLGDMLQSDDLKKAFMEMEEAEKLKDEARFNYRKELELLGLNAKHGEPFKGWCDLCPRILIGKR
jgi:hypothetical protein